jgi:hypothetical protein
MQLEMQEVRNQMKELKRQDIVTFHAESTEISFLGYLEKKRRMEEQCKLRTSIETFVKEHAKLF